MISDIVLFVSFLPKIILFLVFFPSVSLWVLAGGRTLVCVVSTAPPPGPTEGGEGVAGEKSTQYTENHPFARADPNSLGM